MNGEVVKVRQTMVLTFRVIQYADSGYEMVSEYKLTVYPSSEPLVDDLKLVQARMDGPKPFDTLVREYYGTVYKRQNGFAVYAEAEYFDQGDTLWRDGKLTMVARYPKLVAYTTTDENGTPVTIQPGQDGYVTTYERDSQGNIVYYEYQMKDKNGNAWGHLNFTGEFPQQTLPDIDGNNTALGMNFYGNGTDYLPWDVNDFDVVVTLTYPYGYRTHKGLNSYTDNKGHMVNPGDYLDANGNWVADASTDMNAWRDSGDATKVAAYEAASIYRSGSYVVHMTRSNVPILFTTLQNMTAFQPESEKRVLTQIGAILTGADYNDILYVEDANGQPVLDETGNKQLLPPGYQDEEQTIPCDPNFDPAHPYYLLTLDHRMNTTWISMKFDEKNQDVVLTSADVREKFPESYYYEGFNYIMKSDVKQKLDFGEQYYADEDFKTLLQVTVTDRDTGNVARYMIWVVREARSSTDSHINLDLFYGITQNEANTGAQNARKDLQADLYQAQVREDNKTTATVDEGGLWGTLYYDQSGQLQVFEGLVDQSQELYCLADGVVRVANSRAEVPAGGTVLNRVKGFNENVFLYTATLPMSAKYTTLDLNRIGTAQYANVVYNNRFYGNYYGEDGDRANVYDLETPNSQVLLAEKNAADKSLVDVPLKAGERVSYIFVTAHMDLNDAPAGSPLYQQNATTYVIRVKRVNTVAFQNIWVTDTEKTGDATDKDNKPEHYEQMWLMNAVEQPKGEYETIHNDIYDLTADPNGNTFKTHQVDGNTVAYTAEDVAALIDSQGRHDIYDNDITHQYVDYGVMVGALDTYIYLNAEAKGTAADGSNTGYYILIEEYGVENPQFVDSRTFQDGDGQGKITDAKFRLDPSKDGEQIFQFTIVDTNTGNEGVYFLTVFRDHKDTELKVQTHVKGEVTTAAVRVPATQADVDAGYAEKVGDNTNDFEATWKVYYKGDGLKYYKETEYKKDAGGNYVQNSKGNLVMLAGNKAPYPEKETTWYSVDEAVEALGFTVNIGGEDVPVSTLNYAQRFGYLLSQVDETNHPYLEEVRSGKTNRYTGEYDIDFTGLKPGAYMIVFERPGSLGYIIDNVLVYPTWEVAQYDVGSKPLRAGDLNSDGEIGQDDLDIFSQYKTAMDGVYKELLSRVVLASMSHSGAVTTTYQVGTAMNTAELSGIKLLYKDVDVTSAEAAEFSTQNVTFYLGETDYAVNTDGMTQISATSSYTFDHEGTYYLYGVFYYFDSNLTAQNAVQVVYRVAAITVMEANNAFVPDVEPVMPDTPAIEDPIGDPIGDPIVDEIGTGEPVTDEPVTDEPVTGEPVTDEPVIDEIVIGEPEVMELVELVEIGEITELAEITEVTELPETTEDPAVEETDPTVPTDTEDELAEALPEIEEIVDESEGGAAAPAIPDDEETAETPTEPVWNDERPETPPDLERPDEPIGGGEVVDLPDAPIESVTDTPVGTMEALAEYVIGHGIDMESRTAQLLILEYVLLNADTPFNYEALDLNGNGILDTVDMDYILLHWGYTVFGSARMNNMYAKNQAELEAYRP